MNMKYELGEDVLKSESRGRNHRQLDHYGTVNVTAQGNIAYRTASNESEKTSSDYAKEIVDKAE